MKFVLTKLSSGKALGAMLIVGLVAGVCSVFAGRSTNMTTYLRIASIVSFAGFGFFFLYWIKIFGGLLLAKFRDNKAELRKTLAKTSADSKAINDRISRLEDLLAELTDRAHTESRGASDAQVAIDGVDSYGDESLFAFGQLPVSRVSKMNTHRAVGRHAASITLESDSRKNMQRMLNAEDLQWARNIALVGSEELQQYLAKDSRIHELRPYLSKVQNAKECDAVIFEEKAFCTGIWAGALNASRTGAMLELYETVASLKRSGALVIVIEHEASATFTTTLRQLADFQIRGTCENSDSALELIRRLESYASRKITNV